VGLFDIAQVRQLQHGPGTGRDIAQTLTQQATPPHTPPAGERRQEPLDRGQPAVDPPSQPAIGVLDLFLGFREVEHRVLDTRPGRALSRMHRAGHRARPVHDDARSPGNRPLRRHGHVDDAAWSLE
jgi:hypothetical protein